MVPSHKLHPMQIKPDKFAIQFQYAIVCWCSLYIFSLFDNSAGLRSPLPPLRHVIRHFIRSFEHQWQTYSSRMIAASRRLVLAHYGLLNAVTWRNCHRLQPPATVSYSWTTFTPGMPLQTCFRCSMMDR